MRVVLKEEVQKELVIFVMQRCVSVLSTETNKQGQNSTFYTKYTHVVCMELPSFSFEDIMKSWLCVQSYFRPQYNKKSFQFSCLCWR